MWTLQEGIFAKKLYFQLEEGSVSLDDLARSWDPDEQQKVGIHFNLKKHMTGDLIRKLSELSPALLRLHDGRHLLRNIAWRFVSRALDECVCLSILLGKDVAAIEGLPDDLILRVKKFILMQKHFPSFSYSCGTKATIFKKTGSGGHRAPSWGGNLSLRRASPYATTTNTLMAIVSRGQSITVSQTVPDFMFTTPASSLI